MKPAWCTIYSWRILPISFITCTCFGPLYAHHEEEQLYLCETWYLLFFIADCLVCRMEFHSAYQTVSTNTIVPPDDGRGEVRNMYRLQIKLMKYTKNKSCTKLVSFTRFCMNFSCSPYIARASQFYSPRFEHPGIIL